MKQPRPGQGRNRRQATLLAFGLAGAALAAHFLYSQNGSQAPADSDGNVLKNGGFEQQTQGLPDGWQVNKNSAGKGKISVSSDKPHSGRYSLKLEPTGRNTSDLANDPLGVGQGFPAGPFRGKKVYVSGWLAAEGGADALVMAVVLGGQAPVTTQLLQSSPQPTPSYQETVLSVPDDGSANYLILVCVTRGTSGAAYFDDVYLGLRPRKVTRAAEASHAPASQARSLQSAVQPLQATVSVSVGKVVRVIPSTIYGTNLEWIWDGNGLWDAERNALDPTLVRLTRELGPTLLRFPGGVFSDFYHWRDGVGPQQSRPKTPHVPEDPTSSVHRFGTDEALAFADQVGARLLITVNAATGTAQEAAAWVRYVNGQRRRVDYWEIGNEVYFNGTEPHFKYATMTPERYAAKFVEFSTAMRAADPGIKIGAVGDDNYPDRFPHAYPLWDEKVLKAARDQADFLAVHNGYAPSLYTDPGYTVRNVYTGMLAAPLLIAKNLAAISPKIDALGPPASSRIKVGVTEWGPYFQITPDGRFIDHVKTLGSALYVASTLKVLAESPQVQLATAFKLADKLFMGWIGRRGDAWAPTAPYLALQMYTRHFGRNLVESSTTVPGYSSQPIGLVDAVSNVPYLEVIATRSDDGHTVYVMGINKNLDSPVQARITVSGVAALSKGTAWTLNGTGIDANTGTQPFQAPGVQIARQAEAEDNPRFYKGGPTEVTVTSQAMTNAGTTFTYTFPAHSVTSLEIPAR